MEGAGDTTFCCDDLNGGILQRSHIATAKSFICIRTLGYFV